MQKIAEIEDRFGRERTESGYASRQMDIDILYFDELVIETETITIPHQRISERLFVLIPLAEIAPEFVHPQLKTSSLQMLKICPDSSVIKKVEL